VSENVRDLGVVVDSQLCFSEHIANIVRKAHQRANLIQDILLIESVQRKFTKRIPSMSGLTYYSRLQVLGLESLEIRRLPTDVLLVYRIMFGMVRLNSNEFFTLRNQPNMS